MIRRAFHLWASDGAVILTTHRTDAAGMLASVRDVFGPRLLTHQSAHQSPITVSANADVTLKLRIDGYLAYGDHYPDLVFLLCERQATAGGESFIAMASASSPPSPATPPSAR
jgi:Taurine catabolism dioxygenase TauD, TfdA family